MRRLIALGVDAIITNVPDRLANLLSGSLNEGVEREAWSALSEASLQRVGTMMRTQLTMKTIGNSYYSAR